MFRVAPACIAALIATCAAPFSAEAQWPLTSCTPLGKNLYVREALTDLYLWYPRLRGANPAGYGSPEAYLEAVRYRALDSSFSYVTSREASRAFFSESQFVGFGVTLSSTGTSLRILEVFPDSPASEAGLSRGDRLVEIDGVPVAELMATNRLDAALGPPVVGVAAEIVFVNGAGSRRVARLVKRVVTIPTVSRTAVYEAGGTRVGYIHFRNFVQPSYAALDAAFAELARAGAHELVLDLRYNGGGLIDVARHLAGLIGGARTRGQVFARFIHNDRNFYRNEITRFSDATSPLTLTRLIAITTQASASASELVINALRPFMPVVVIGDRTFGKPVGQYQIPFCDKLLAPVAFSVRNANGEGDFYDGIPPTCPASDDADRQLGDPAEASLREAITFAATGACTPRLFELHRRPAGAHAARAGEGSPRRAAGWQSVVNAY